MAIRRMKCSNGEYKKRVCDIWENRFGVTKKESVQETELYHYNTKNQLTHLQSGTDTLRYLYDSQGNLLEEQGQGSQKQYCYDAANRQVGIVATKADGVTENCTRQTGMAAPV